jgi:hypothetical protein
LSSRSVTNLLDDTLNELQQKANANNSSPSKRATTSSITVTKIGEHHSNIKSAVNHLQNLKPLPALSITPHITNILQQQTHKMSDLSQVENLLKDQESQYMTDDSSDEDDEQKSQTILTLKRKSTDAPMNDVTQSPETKKVKTPIKPLTPLENKLPQEIEETDDTVIKEFNTSMNISLQNTDKNGSALCIIDPRKVSTEILKFKRLSSWTYLCPYIESTLNNSTKTLPFYLCLDDLAKDASNKKYIKCKLIAKLFEFSQTSGPSIGSVFVHCKKCHYINFTPFHLAHIYHSGQLSLILNEINQIDASSSNSKNQINTSTQILSSIESEDQFQDFEENLEKNAVNFDLNWLQTAMPAQSNQIAFTQANTQIAKNVTPASSEEAIFYEYECPRCLYNTQNNIINDQENNNNEKRVEEMDTDVILVDNNNINLSQLEYIYRFWFVLRDGSGRLDPCLLEGKLAEKFLGNVPPIKFYTQQAKSHVVYKTIIKKFSQKCLFTIEAFNLDLESNFQIEAKNYKKFKVVYKIVDIDELV